MKKFVEHFEEIYNEKDAKFVEKQGRKIFLLYLKPILNGVGNYYIEAQTRDEISQRLYGDCDRGSKD